MATRQDALFDESPGDPLEELATLRTENARLRRLLELTSEQARPPGPSQTGSFDGATGPVTAASTPEEKLAFYRSLFAARTDVHALRWDNSRTGAGGWLPAVAGGWRRGVPHAKRSYLPLTDDVVRAHLTGSLALGLYPLLDDDTCWWLAADFDGGAAVLDALAYVKSCRALRVPAAMEVSRSGVGAHVWVFFTRSVAAARARRLGTALLREAMAQRGQMDLSSYDRLFPSQDVLPAGGVGNLIAAPLHGGRRRDGATVFLDLATMEPHADQWAFLSTLPRMTPRELDAALRGADQDDDEARATARPARASRIRVSAPVEVRVRLGAGVEVSTAGMPPALLAALKHAASLPNPEFFARQRRRASTYGVPRFVRSYSQTWTPQGEVLLTLPRGTADRVEQLVVSTGSRWVVEDSRTSGSPLDAQSTATLTTAQHAAVAACLAHDTGVLVAPPGAGKTVMACEVIACRGVSTLVLVDRRALADQWRTRLRELLDIGAGQLGGGRSRLSGAVDVALLPTLARREDVAELTAGYGQVVVDECHHVPAVAFERAVSAMSARYWLGLTATPYRRDGLDALISHHLGPVRHTTSDDAARTAAPGTLPGVRGLSSVARVLHVHETGFVYRGTAEVGAPGGISAVYRELVADDARTAQVVADVVEALARGRNCLVLTQWRDHLDRVTEALTAHVGGGTTPVVLRGGMGAKQRAAAMAQLAAADRAGPLLVVATGPFVGEGFDCPALDTLFLAAPIAFRGRLVQYVGRILREHPGKESAEVHDYHDVLTGVLASSLVKRSRGYRELGFPLP